jgi:membrane protein required for colicin V production
MAFLKKLLNNFIKLIGLIGLNYIIGIGFGIIRGIFVCALLVIVIQMFNLDNSKSYTQSKLYPILSPIISWIADAIPHSVKEMPKPPPSIMELYK